MRARKGWFFAATEKYFLPLAMLVFAAGDRPQTFI
jgi:hypothetical protein